MCLCQSDPLPDGVAAGGTATYIVQAHVLTHIVLLAILSCVSAFAQNYPSKPVRIVTGAPGGGSDFDARQIAQGLTVALGQQVLVDNRATTILAAEAAMKLSADGYSILLFGSSSWTYQLLQTAPYDARQFAPVTLVETAPNVVAVHPSVPVTSIGELIAFARKRAGQLNYASVSIGGPQHLAAELFKSMAGINIVHVPYKGNAPAALALVSGEVHLMFSDIGLLMPLAKLGKLRALAITSAAPFALVPELPTVASAGLSGYEMIGLTGLFAPPKTPVSIIERLNLEIVRFLNTPNVKQRFLAAGLEVVASTPSELTDRLKADLSKTEKLIRAANIKIE